MIEYLENKIKSCDELGGMEKEKWAFIQCLKHYRENSNQVQAGVMLNEVLAGGQYCRDCKFENKSICDNPSNRQMLILEDDERFYIYPKFGCNKFESKPA